LSVANLSMQCIRLISYYEKSFMILTHVSNVIKTFLTATHSWV
jgi:hypothetical protein